MNQAAGECNRVHDQLETNPTYDDGDRQYPLEADLKVFADTDVCQTYANRVLETPEIFGLDESSGTVHLISATPRPEFEDAVRRAVAECSVRALSVQE